MATPLVAQLAQIRAKSSNSLDLKAQRKAHSQSLLFEPRDAATQDFDTVYQLCYEAFLELCQIDPRFGPFAQNLFSEQSKQEDRTQMIEAENEQLNVIIEDFLALVGSRLLLKPAVRAVEWLVRRFRIHEHNTIPLVLTFLPYHTHSMFPTVLAIIPQNIPSTLKFLSPYKESLGNPSRHTIVYTATHNQAFLAALNSYVLRVCRLQFQYNILLSFWAAVVAEATAAMIDLARSGRQEVQRQQQEDIIMRILPMLNDGMSLSGVSDLRIGCYMIVTVLASKAGLSTDALTALMDAVTWEWAGTTHAGLICLAVLAQRRDSPELPRRTFEALMSITNLEDDLRILKAQYRVDKLVLGVITGILRKLRKKPNSILMARLRALISASLMDTASTTAAAQAILRLIEKAEANQELNLVDPLSQIIIRQAAADEFGALVRDLVLESSEAPDPLKQQLRENVHGSRIENVVVDQDMPNVSEPQPTESFDDLVKHILPLASSEGSFLRTEIPEFFNLVHLFTAAIDSTEDLDRFLKLPILGRSTIMTSPHFISFLMRVWTGPFSVKARIAALDVLTRELEGKDLVADVQISIPYLLCALTDPVTQVRRISSELVILLTKAYKGAVNTSGGRTQIPILQDNAVFDQKEDPDNLPKLSFHDTLTFFEDFLIPSLEESLLDPSHVGRLFGDVMNGTAHRGSRKENARHFKSSWKHAAFLFLCGHAIITPLRRVQGRLLGILNKVSKVGGTSRTKALLPLLRSCISEKEEVFHEKCALEQVEPGEFVRQLVSIVSPADQHGILVLQALIKSGERQKHTLFEAAALEHIAAMWPSMKANLKSALADQLLDSALSSTDAALEKTRGIDAMDVLRNIELPTSILRSFLEGLPPLTGSAKNEASIAKRRKTNYGHDASRSDAGTVDDSLRKYTVVLELTDSCALDGRVELLGGFFKVLENLESYRRETSADPAYLEVITLNNAYGIISKFQKTPGSQIDRSSIKADVLISCATQTENPQVQQAALLLVASIASAAPELILHSVMPIFTFMGTGIMRNSDDYSVYVVKKMMDSVIPELMHSLLRKNGHPIVNASELLVSFVVAYKDIPAERRQDIFFSLVKKIGPDQFLFALVLLLVDKYPGRRKALDFATLLVSCQPIDTKLITIENYLDVVVDLLNPKPNLAPHLLTNTALGSKDDKISNVLPLAITVLKDKRLKVEAKTASSDHYRCAKILERILTLREKSSHSSRVTVLCNEAQDAVLGLMTVDNFVASLPPLFERTSSQSHIGVLQSLEARVRDARSDEATARKACLAFLQHLRSIIAKTADVALQRTAIACTDQIVEKFGKKDLDAVSAAASTMASHQYLAAADNGVRIAALLCLATMAEVLGEALIPIIPQAIPLAIDSLAASLDEDAEDHRLHNACYAFVTSLLLYIPWMFTGSYVDRLLKVSYESSNAEMGVECSDTRIETLKLLAKSLDPKDCFVALDRTWTNAVAEGPLAVKEHLEILLLAIESKPKSVITKQADTLATLFLKIFDLRRIQFSPRTEDSYEDIEVSEVENAANDTLIAMIYKINDTTFRPIFTRFLEWSTTPTSKTDKKSRIYRQTIIWTFLLKFFSTLKSIVTNYAGLITDDAVEILKTISIKDTDSRLLWERTVLTLQSTFSHDQDDFFQSPKHFPPLATVLLAQLPHISTSSHSTTLIPHLISTITLLGTTTDAPAQHRLICTPLLQFMRDDTAAVRLAAVKTQLSLTERMGEEWLAQLPEMLPFVGEGMEDDDEGVEMEVRRWVRKIEEVLGESIAPMLQ